MAFTNNPFDIDELVSRAVAARDEMKHARYFEDNTTLVGKPLKIGGNPIKSNTNQNTVLSSEEILLNYDEVPKSKWRQLLKGTYIRYMDAKGNLKQGGTFRGFVDIPNKGIRMKMVANKKGRKPFFWTANPENIDSIYIFNKIRANLRRKKSTTEQPHVASVVDEKTSATADNMLPYKGRATTGGRRSAPIMQTIPSSNTIPQATTMTAEQMAYQNQTMQMYAQFANMTKQGGNDEELDAMNNRLQKIEGGFRDLIKYIKAQERR